MGTQSQRSAQIPLIRLAGKVGMSVLTKGMAMDFVREGKKDMAITSIWPASVSPPRWPRLTNADLL